MREIFGQFSASSSETTHCNPVHLIICYLPMVLNMHGRQVLNFEDNYHTRSCWA